MCENEVSQRVNGDPGLSGLLGDESSSVLAYEKACACSGTMRKKFFSILIRFFFIDENTHYEIDSSK